MIGDRIRYITEKIDRAAVRSGRRLDDITLVAVSKTFPIEKIIDAYNSGLRIFGESRLQEAAGKIEHLKAFPDIKFHMIGHLQTNKIRMLKDYFSLVHSVDSVHLAKKMNDYFYSINRVQDILIQVNLVNEPQKYGIKIEEFDEMMEKMKSFPNLRVRGLMFIPPFYDDPEMNRGNFRRMKVLFDETKKKYKEFKEFDILSMGMSDDFEIAIEEGANMVRIGSAIFGERV
ncbi:YggS family pyridoxal phosphate-dependent enzyme [Calditerrivibrio sp.]|uniref:YggS family pyridoxal phosphate-dependent enzyme n=1 Tax=Calditerrivibrio sp. TaxID=2792612 RepID=UPI003D09F234